MQKNDNCHKTSGKSKRLASPRSIFKEVYMKAKIMCIFAALMLFAGCLGSGSVREAGYMPGIYEGSGRGYRGPVHVRIQIAQAGIEYIAIISHRESIFPGLAAMEELLDAVLEYETTDLDVVSGATFSSRGFLEAVESALKKARQ